MLFPHRNLHQDLILPIQQMRLLDYPRNMIKSQKHVHWNNPRNIIRSQERVPRIRKNYYLIVRKNRFGKLTIKLSVLYRLYLEAVLDLVTLEVLHKILKCNHKCQYKETSRWKNSNHHSVV